MPSGSLRHVVVRDLAARSAPCRCPPTRPRGDHLALLHIALRSPGVVAPELAQRRAHPVGGRLGLRGYRPISTRAPVQTEVVHLRGSHARRGTHRAFYGSFISGARCHKPPPISTGTSGSRRSARVASAFTESRPVSGARFGQVSRHTNVTCAPGIRRRAPVGDDASQGGSAVEHGMAIHQTIRQPSDLPPPPGGSGSRVAGAHPEPPLKNGAWYRRLPGGGSRSAARWWSPTGLVAV